MKKVKTFKNLKFQARVGLAGIQATIFFDNGYGVSVVRGFGSYGYDEGLYEIAVSKGNSTNRKLCYDTPVTGDVIGYCDEDKVTEVMKQVQDLPPYTTDDNN